MFALKTGIYSKKISVDKNEIYCWVLNKDSITTVSNKNKFQDIVDLAIRKNSLMKKNLEDNIYNRNRPTMIYYLTTSFIRYKYGMLYTYRVFLKLSRNNILFARTQDLKIDKMINFFKNNKHYSKTI